MPNNKSLNAENKINTMLGKRIDVKNSGFNMAVGKRAFSGTYFFLMPNTKIDINAKISGAFAYPKKNINFNFNGGALNKIKSTIGSSGNKPDFLKKLGNPESVAVNRMSMGRGLSLFGDKDKDGLANVFDCNPLNVKKQAEYHDMIDIDDIVKRSPVRDDMGQPEDVNITNTAEVYDDNDFSYSESYVPESDMGGMSYSGTTQSTDMLNAQIDEARNKMNSATNDRDKRLYSNLLISLMKQRPSYDEEQKTLRAKSKEAWDKSKWELEQQEKSAEKEHKYNLGLAQLGAEYGLKEKQFEASRKDNKFDKAMSQKQFYYQKERDSAKDLERLRKDKIAYELEKSRIRRDEGKNDRMLWENKLRYGTNVINSVTGMGATGVSGPASVPVFQRQPVTPQSISGGNIAVGRVEPNLNNMMMLTGANQQSMSFNEKVANMVGRGYTPPMQQTQPAPQYRETQPMNYQEYRRQPNYRQPAQQPVQTRGVDWDAVTPEQAAQYDPENAKYLKESSDKRYRRGPYKKG